MRKFSTSANGYSKAEVNDFISEVIVEYERMLNNLKERDKEIKKLKDKLKYLENMESTLNRAILAAEDSSNQIRKVAKDEARLTIEDAKKNASRIVNEALLKAEKIDIETEQLKKRLRIYKARIKQTIEEQLVMVDDIDKIDY